MWSKAVWWSRILVPVFAIVTLAVTALTGVASGRITNTAHSISGPGQWTAISEVRKLNGTVVDTWSGSDGSVASVSGLPGLRLVVTPDADRFGSNGRVDHGVTISIQGGGILKALAAGRTERQAMQLARYVYYQPCATYTAAGGYVSLHGCDTQWLDAANGGDWYMADQMEVSAASSSVWNARLTQLYNYVSYDSGNEVVKWTPNATISTGSCTTVTIGYTSSQSGLSYTESSQVCPNSIGPYTVTATKYGTVWNGRESASGQYEATEGEDEVHNPPSVYPGMGYFTHVSWCSYFC